MRTVASAIVPAIVSVVSVVWVVWVVRVLAPALSLVQLGCGRPDAEKAAGAGGASDGKALFEQTCARCHAANGKGDPVARAQLGVPDMTEPAWQAAHPDELIKRTVREGSKSKKMPPFGTLYSDGQLDAIIAHVRTLRTGPK